MSELKAYTFSAMERIGLAEYYLKSEADKVIEELQSKVTLASLAEDCNNLRHKRCNYCSELQRQKYKRCLAMANMCAEAYNRECGLNPEEMTDKEFYKQQIEFWPRWNSKWLKIGEKFKEAK